MKEVIEAFSSRVRSPLFGYFVIALIIINWRALLVLWLADSDIETRIEIFSLSTDYISLFIYPLLASALSAVLYPWINLFFLRIAHKPAIHKNTLQLTTDHERLLQQSRLESLRNEILTKKEEGLIEQAKRDQEVQNIEDKKLRENLEKELELLRREKDSLVKLTTEETQEKTKNKKNPKHEEFEKYLQSGKLDDFIANREEILSRNSIAPSSIANSSTAQAFGLLSKAGINVTLSNKGKEFFEWWILHKE